jgi:hypothetical protein
MSGWGPVGDIVDTRWSIGQSNSPLQEQGASGLGCRGTSRTTTVVRDARCRSLRRLQNSELLERSGAVIKANLLHNSTARHAKHRRTGKAHLAA